MLLCSAGISTIPSLVRGNLIKGVLGSGPVFVAQKRGDALQLWLVMEYLAGLREDQTLVLYSGHPLGVFPAPRSGPRLVITNGMVVPNYSSRDMYENLFALGVTM